MTRWWIPMTLGVAMAGAGGAQPSQTSVFPPPPATVQEALERAEASRRQMRDSAMQHIASPDPARALLGVDEALVYLPDDPELLEARLLLLPQATDFLKRKIVRWDAQGTPERLYFEYRDAAHLFEDPDLRRAFDRARDRAEREMEAARAPRRDAPGRPDRDAPGRDDEDRRDADRLGRALGDIDRRLQRLEDVARLDGRADPAPIELDRRLEDLRREQMSALQDLRRQVDSLSRDVQRLEREVARVGRP